MSNDNEMWSFCMTSNPEFNVTVLFKGKFLKKWSILETYQY